ncbi:MAG: hypothetical protein EXQ59_04050 [Acidobacteria bacterium]|nr:hypothetical protein [Acidobacteriota bacterium]
MNANHPQLPRRSFLSRFGAGATALGVALGVTVRPALAQSAAPGPPQPWQPARHAEDDWLDEVPGKHRLFMDTTTPAAFGQAVFFANNFYTGNRTGYGLTDADCAVVICARHQSTAFAYADAMWAKYGGPLAERAGFSDPKTKQPPTVNVYQATGYGPSLLNLGVTVDAVTRRGLRFAVCQLATRANASIIAQRTGANVDDVFKELAANLVPNARLVQAGIVAVNRAQERGYSFSYVT